MEALRSWGSSLCFMALACAVLRFVVPKNGLGRLVEWIGGLLFLCCLFSPLATVNWQELPQFSLTETAREQLLSARVQEQLQPALQQAVQQAGDESLAAHGLSAEKIEAVTDIDENGGIYISKIVVRLNEEQAVRRILVRQVLETRFSVNVEIDEEVKEE